MYINNSQFKPIQSTKSTIFSITIDHFYLSNSKRVPIENYSMIQKQIQFYLFLCSYHLFVFVVLLNGVVVDHV